MKKLLQLKGDYKALTGKDWKPGMKPEVSVNNTSNTSAAAADPPADDAVKKLTAQITDQGNLVRDLKTKKSSKVIINNEYV